MQEYSRSPGRFRLGVQLPDGTRATAGTGDSPPVMPQETDAVLTLLRIQRGMQRHALSRRMLAIAALLLLAASVVLAVVLGVQRFPRGLAVLACVILSVASAWWSPRGSH